MALLPLVSVVQWPSAFETKGDPRKATPLPVLQVRAADKNRNAPELFNEPLVTVAFDDGWESIYTQGMSTLSKYGIPTTQYIISGSDKQSNYMSTAQIAEMERTGHEIDSHTVSHADLTTLTDAELDKELQESGKILRQRFPAAINDFASPYGKSDERVRQHIEKYYRSHRNTSGDFRASDNNVNLSGNFDRYNILSTTIRRGTTVADIQRLVEYAKTNNAWLVLTYHQIDNGPSDYGVSSDALAEQMAYLSKTDVRTVTMGEVLDTIAPTRLPEF